jgi:hypothetical protein
MATQDELNKAYHDRRALGVERLSNGETQGIDPRKISISLLKQIGHRKMPLLKIIRAKCMNCSGCALGEVRSCTFINCPLWPYRMGTNPFSTRTGNPKAIAALRAARKTMPS